jgi:heme exporter protein D
MSDYFNMGGYAAFVWPAFALSFGVLGALLFASLKNLRASEKALDDIGAASPREDSTA